MTYDNKIFAQNLTRYLEMRKISQRELSRILGVSPSTVSSWCTGMKIPRMGMIEKLARYFGIGKSDLIEIPSHEKHIIPAGFIPVPKMQRVPIVGEIACGEPITAEQNITGTVDAPSDRQIDFALVCKGDSMIEAGIKDGDIVYIRKQPQVENGQIAAVRIDNEATLKRVYFHGDTLILQPANINYPPLSFSGVELENVMIEGLAVGFTHWI